MNWISSTENERWSDKNNIVAQVGTKITIGEPMGKPIYGFGSCISEICVKALKSLGEEKYNAIMSELFSKDKCAFNFCRLSIGANDFAESWYSYNETEDDYEMKNFSIERDKKYIIPAIKEAQKHSPELMFFASPWSPPTWMKFPKVYNFGNIVRTKENLSAYALYLRKYIEEYQKEGIKINQLHIQNEMISTQKFPSCIWSGEAMVEFIADYLIDEIKDLTEIWLGTLNGPENDDRLLTSRHNQYLGYVMQNKKCRENIKGASFQWAGKFGITQANEDYPELNLIQSECECGDGDNSWQYAMYTYEMMHHYFRFGARANVYWNIALDNDGLSTWGWRQNSLISVKNGEYTLNPEFYLIKHFSHFIKRDAVLLKTEGSFSSNTTVFRNPDGDIVAVIMNPYDERKVVTINDKNFELKPRSFNTIVF